MLSWLARPWNSFIGLWVHGAPQIEDQQVSEPLQVDEVELVVGETFFFQRDKFFIVITWSARSARRPVVGDRIKGSSGQDAIVLSTIPGEKNKYLCRIMID